MREVAAACTPEAKIETPDEPIVEKEPGYQDPENPDIFVGGTTIKFSAVIDEEESKSTISGNSINWESGDAISILWNGGRTIATTSDTGASAEFETNVDESAAGGVYYGVCPSTVGCELDAENADVVKVTVPASQDGTFTSANINVAKTTATSFSFKAVGNLISFTISNENVKKVRIYSYDQSAIAGTCAVNVASATPVLGTYSDTSDMVEVAVDGAGTYYATVLPGTHAEGLLFVPLTAEGMNCRAAYASKSFTFIRKGNTDFGAIESHVGDLYVSAAGTGKGLSSSTPMSPAAFVALLSQPKDDEGNQIDADAVRHHALLYGSTVHILDNIAIDETKVEFTGGLKTCQFTIEGASAEVAITPTGTDRMFRFSNNTNVTFSQITLSGANLASGNGGAILIENGSTGNAEVTCNNVTFSGNTAAGNAGAVAVNAGSKKASFTAVNCTFSGNSSSANGGAFYQSASSDANAANSSSSFTGCTFSENSAAKGGVAQVYRGTATFGDGNVFTKNAATADGGVFYVNGTSGKSSLVVTGGTFGGASLDDANSAAGSSNGGGVLYKEGGDASFSNATFKYNKASANNGGVAVFNKSAASFENCTFSYNQATKNGGAFYFTGNSSATLTNCTADHNSAVSGGFAQVYKGTLNVDGASSDYRQNSATSDGGFAYLNHADAKLNLGLNTTDGTVKLFQNTAVYGGAISQETGASVVNIANAVFDANKASNKAGAIFVSVGNWTVNNSQFLNNQSDESASKTVSDTKDDGMGGAMVVKGSGTVNIDGCYFENNISGKKDNTDSKSYGGVIVINNGTVNCTNSEFNANKGNRGAVLFMVSGGGGKFTADRCSFHGNKYWCRGVLYIQTKNIAYMNRCTFYDEAPRAVTSDCYGTAIHAAGTTSVCLNNCTVNITTQQGYTKNIQVLNTDGGMLLTNNTIIGYVRNGVVRTGATDTYFSCLNNVIINTNSGQQSYNIKSTTGFYEGYNVLGATNAMNDTPGISATSKTVSDASAFTWATDWYTWAGPSSIDGFTACSQADVTAAYDNFAVDASGWGGCLGSISNVGSNFKSWLESLNPVGYNVNQHGDARGAAYWPGSYQN